MTNWYLWIATRRLFMHHYSIINLRYLFANTKSATNTENNIILSCPCSGNAIAADQRFSNQAKFGWDSTVNWYSLKLWQLLNSNSWNSAFLLILTGPKSRPSPSLIASMLTMVDMRHFLKHYSFFAIFFSRTQHDSKFLLPSLACTMVIPDTNQCINVFLREITVNSVIPSFG